MANSAKSLLSNTTTSTTTTTTTMRTTTQTVVTRNMHKMTNSDLKVFKNDGAINEAGRYTKTKKTSVSTR